MEPEFRQWWEGQRPERYTKGVRDISKNAFLAGHSLATLTMYQSMADERKKVLARYQAKRTSDAAR